MAFNPASASYYGYHAMGEQADTRQADDEQLRDALRAIDTPSASGQKPYAYAVLYPVSMALKTALGESGRSLYDEWVARSHTYRSAYADRFWEGLKPNGKLGLGTVFEVARQHGYQRVNRTADVNAGGRERGSKSAVPVTAKDEFPVTAKDDVDMAKLYGYLRDCESEWADDTRDLFTRWCKWFEREGYKHV